MTSRQRIAAIDFGTNTARLLIADTMPDAGFEQVLLRRSIVRMGGGFSRDSGLSTDAIERGLSCLRGFSEEIRRHEVTSVRAVATSAVRDAVNGLAFVGMVERETGIRLSVIDGDTEGRITLQGVMTALDMHPENILMFDIGGGSTEYIFARGSSPIFVESLPLGVVRLTEGKAEPDAIMEKIGRELGRLEEAMSAKRISLEATDTLLVGTAGTATTLAAISMEMEDYDYRRVNNFFLDLSEIRRIYNMLLPLTPSERLSVAGLEKGREDLIVAGALVTMITMERFGFNSMKVSDYGLLEGLLTTGLLFV